MAKISIGLDIGYSSIKVVALDLGEKPPKLISLGAINTPLPGIASDSDVELESVAASIKKLLIAAKIETREVVVALPESKVFTRVIDDLPYLTDQELDSAIRFAAEEFIPLPADQVNLNYQIIARGKDKNSKTVVFVVASPKSVVNKYLKVLNMAALSASAMETEIIASTRSLVGDNTLSPTTAILQIGASATDLAVVSKGVIWLTRSIATGGLALTRAVAQHLNFELHQAEEYKKTYGLEEEALSGKVLEVLKPIIDIIVTEAKRSIQSYETKYPADKIKRMVLSGGGAKMPGLVKYCATNLGLEVQEADPWSALQKDKTISTKLISDGPLYTVAVGLALRGQNGH